MMKKSTLFLLTLLCVSFVSSGVTFNVKVPSGTKKCFVCGDFNGWDAGGALEMNSMGNDLFTLTLDNISETAVKAGFKYLCGQDWIYVEKDASGGEISNRTSLGNPDVVGSWYNVPEWDIESFEHTVNGYPRLIKVYLPEGYDNDSETYPVIYYNTVQQRYNDAGNDADGGDYLFGLNSWNGVSAMEANRDGGGKAYIMVQICSFLGENTPEKNEEYVGTGNASTYLNALITELFPVIESKWRVKKGSENTIIMGADYSGLFSVYAALNRPDVFGKCIAVSPMLWINAGALTGKVSSSNSGQSYFITSGSLEPDWMKTDAQALANDLSSQNGVSAYFTLYQGMAHDDADWGKCLPDIIRGMDNNQQPSGSLRINNKERKVETAPFETRTYTLYGGADEKNLQKIGYFEYTENFRKKRNRSTC